MQAVSLPTGLIDERPPDAILIGSYPGEGIFKKLYILVALRLIIVTFSMASPLSRLPQAIVQVGVPCYTIEPVPLERTLSFLSERAGKIGVYMSLLREIQDGATEDSVSLGSLLRKTKLLTARIGVKEI